MRLLLSVILLSISILLKAEQYVFFGPGDYSDTNLWSPSFPDNLQPGDEVVFAEGDCYNAIFDIPFGVTVIVFNSTCYVEGDVTNDGEWTITESGSVIFSGTTLNNNGIVNISGSFEKHLDFYYDGIINNDGTINVTGSLLIDSDTENSGTLFCSEGTITNYGLLTNQASANINMFFFNLENYGTITNDGAIDFSEGAVVSEGVVTNNNYIQNNSDFYNGTNGFLFNYSEFDNVFGIGNDGTILNEVGSTFNNPGQINNSGTFTNKGLIGSDNNGFIENYLTFINSGTINKFVSFGNYGELTNETNGLIDSEYFEASLYNGVGASIQNSGTISSISVTTSEGTIDNSGLIQNVGSIGLVGGGQNSGTIQNVFVGLFIYAPFVNDGQLMTVELIENYGPFTNNNTASGIADFYNESDFVNNGDLFVSIFTNNGGVENNDYIQNDDVFSSSTYILNNGTIQNNTQLTNLGVFDNFGDINSVIWFQNEGPLTNTGTISVQGTFQNEADLINDGVLTNDGNITNVPLASIHNLVTITNNGGFINDGNVNNEGTINCSGTFTNYSTLTNQTTGEFNSTGELVNQFGIIENYNLFFTKIFSNAGVFTNNSGYSSDQELNNWSTFENNGNATIYGAVSNNANFNNYGTLENYAAFNNGTFFFNTGTFNNRLGGGSFETSDMFINGAGVFNNEGPFLIDGGSFTNQATFDNQEYATFTFGYGSSGSASNTGIFNNWGEFTIEENRTFTNESTFNNYSEGQIYNNGTFESSFYMDCQGSLYGSGILSISGGALFKVTGKILPGNSIGTKTVFGDLTIEGTYESEMDGNGTQDLIDVTGQLNISGSTLDLKWIDSGNVVPGDYTIASFGSRVGEFANVIEPTNNNSYTVIYNSNSIVVNVGVALPVNFLDFVGSQEKEQIVLNWTTSSEINNDGFYIERRDKTEDWQTIGFVEGRNGVKEESYDFVDYPKMTGDYLYRLRQVDFNAGVNYSDIISVRYRIDKKLSLSKIQEQGPYRFMFTSEATSQISFLVVDNNGRQVYKQEFAPNELVDLSSLHSGIYFYQAQQGQTIQSGKLFIK